MGAARALAYAWALRCWPRRMLRADLPEALLAPVGMAILVALVMPVYRLGGGHAAALSSRCRAPSPASCCSGRSLPGRLNWGGRGCGAGCLRALHGAGGLERSLDVAGLQLRQRHGRELPVRGPAVAPGGDAPGGAGLLHGVDPGDPVKLGYPVGAHGAAGHDAAAHRRRDGRRLPPAHRRHRWDRRDGDVAACAACAGLRAGGRGGGRASCPSGVVLLYRYALHGGIKEVLVVALLATGAALAREALDRELSLRLVMLLALCAVSLLHVFSAVGAAYGLLLGSAHAGRRSRRGPRRSRRLGASPWWGLAIAVVAVAVEPLGRRKLRRAGQRCLRERRAGPAPPTSGICCGRFRSCRRRACGWRATTGSR